MLPVKLNLYDLSGGAAKIHKTGDAVWMTGLVVYGKEFYFGDGVCHDLPGKTPFGVPKRQADIGHTEIPEEVFIESMLVELSDRFKRQNYRINICDGNHFTDECAQFLTSDGQGIPKHLLSTNNKFCTSHKTKNLVSFLERIIFDMVILSNPIKFEEDQEPELAFQVKQDPKGEGQSLSVEQN